MNPKISIIVPIYNSEKFLHICLDSILNQSFPDFELILVNDCSPDNSLEIMQNYAEQDDRIKIIDLSENIRQGGARNRGLDIARGKYICFVDSDDYIHPQLLEKVYRMSEKEQADFCGFNYIRVADYYPQLLQADLSPAKAAEKIQLKQDAEQDRWLSQIISQDRDLTKEQTEFLIMHTAGVWNNFFLREIIEKNHLRFPEKKAYEDNYFVKLFCFYVRRYAYIAEPFYYYYINESSTTQEVNPAHAFDRLEIEEMKIKAYQERGFFEKYHSAIEIDFLKLYYLNSIGLFFTKMTNPPIDKIKEMTKRLEELFPHITKNKYYRSHLKFTEKAKYQIARRFPSLLKLYYMF